MPAVERAGPVSARVNGNQAPGMMALNLAVDTAIDQANNGLGVSVVGVSNTSTSSGMLAYYGEKLATAGLVGVIVATSPEGVAVRAGAAPVFGTNPMCFAFPRPAVKRPAAGDRCRRHCTAHRPAVSRARQHDTAAARGTGADVAHVPASCCAMCPHNAAQSRPTGTTARRIPCKLSKNFWAPPHTYPLSLSVFNQ